MNHSNDPTGRRRRGMVLPALAGLLCATPVLTVPAVAEPIAERHVVGDFAIDVTEVSIDRFRSYAGTSGLATRAERDGGGYEYDAGWQQRRGWTWDAPYGRPGADDEPAVHVNWHEAQAFCAAAGGRLPSFDEWRQAAYVESRTQPTDGYERGRAYSYPVGDQPHGMNTSERDPWPRHAPVGSTRRGVNGLYDMGANVWEWLADRRGDTALTAGGSWWYGPHMTRAEGAQYKPADFGAVYIGFRCAYDAD